MEPKADAFPKFSGRAVVEGSLFLFSITPKVSKIIDLIIFPTGGRWVAHSGNWSFSCCDKQPFSFFVSLPLATLWQCRNLTLILLIRSTIPDVLTYWTGSSALGTGKSWSPDVLVLFCLFISSHTFYFSEFLWWPDRDTYDNWGVGCSRALIEILRFLHEIGVRSLEVSVAYGPFRSVYSCHSPRQVTEAFVTWPNVTNCPF